MRSNCTIWSLDIICPFSLCLILFPPRGLVGWQRRWRTASPFQKSASDDRALPSAPEDVPTLPKSRNQKVQRGQVKQGCPADTDTKESISKSDTSKTSYEKVCVCVWWTIIPAAFAVVTWQAVDSPSGQSLVEPGACHGRYQHQCGLNGQKRPHIVFLRLVLLNHWLANMN